MGNMILRRSSWEYLIPGLAISSLLAACWLASPKKIFWNDELYSYYLLSDPSFSHMLAAFHDKINTAPPLYFLLGWLWTRGFGSTPLSLRLFSSAGIGVATFVTWLSLRNVYGFRLASIGALTVFCSSQLILDQNIEARMYGMFLAVASLLVLQFQINNFTSRCERSLLVSNAFIHGAIVQIHLFGSFYSSGFLVAQMAQDRSRGIFRANLYAVIVLSWVPLVLYLPSFLNQADAGSPRFWIPSSSITDLVQLLIDAAPSGPILVVLGCIALLSGGFIALSGRSDCTALVENANRRHGSECPLIVIGCAFFVIPIAVFVISWIKPLFIERYMIPTAVSWAIFIAAVANRIVGRLSTGGRAKSLALKRGLEVGRSGVFLIVLAACVVYPLWTAKRLAPRGIPGTSDAQYGYESLPVVVQHSHDFLTRLYYSPQPDRYFFILDWPSAVDVTSGLFSPQEYKHLEALKRQYPTTFKNVVDGDKFLETTKRFLVITRNYDQRCSPETQKRGKWDNLRCPRWVLDRLLADSRFRVQPLGDIWLEARQGVVLLVEKVAK
jgi:hypothetical protein